MNIPLKDIPLDHLAFVTGHKVRGLFRRPAVNGTGMVSWCLLDGQQRPVAAVRRELEAEYTRDRREYEAEMAK